MTLRLGTTTRRLDTDLIEQGKTKECPLRPGLRVTYLPAATYNRRFKQALAKRPLDAAGDADFSDRRQTYLDRVADPEVMVEALVLTMEGIYDADGEEVEYTPEVGLQVLSDPGNVDVLQWLTGECVSHGQFYTETVEKDEGNSGNGSSGKRAGAGRSKKTKR